MSVESDEVQEVESKAQNLDGRRRLSLCERVGLNIQNSEP